MSQSVLPREQLEQQIRAHANEQRWGDAATCALQGYGAEVLGFLYAIVPNPSDADDLFSALCERVWLKFSDFRFESSCRTWLYGIARNLAHEQRRARERREQRFAELEGNSAAAAVAAQVRSSTAVHLRSQTKSRLHEIRDALPPDDRMLLVLRLDRKLAWKDIARVLSEPGAEDETLARESSRLRKRFERVKATVAQQLRASMAKN